MFVTIAAVVRFMYISLPSTSGVAISSRLALRVLCGESGAGACARYGPATPRSSMLGGLSAKHGPGRRAKHYGPDPNVASVPFPS